MTNKDIDHELEQLEESVIHMNDSFHELARLLHENKKFNDPLAVPDRNGDGNLSPDEVRKEILKRDWKSAQKDDNDFEIRKRKLRVAVRENPENPEIKKNLDNTVDRSIAAKSEKSNAYQKYISCNIHEDLNNISNQSTRQPIAPDNDPRIESLENAKEKVEEQKARVEESTKKVKEITSNMQDETGAIKKSVQNREQRDAIRQKALDGQIKNINNEIEHQEQVAKQAENRIKNQQDLNKKQEAERKLAQAQNESYAWLRESAYATPEDLAFSGKTGLILDIMINNVEVDDPALMDTAIRLRDSAMMRNLLFKFKGELSKANPDAEKMKYLKNQIRKEINNYMKTN